MAQDIIVHAFIQGDYKKGIYTGCSAVTNTYNVSFFDGSTGRYAAINSIHFDTEDGTAPTEAHALKQHDYVANKYTY